VKDMKKFYYSGSLFFVFSLPAIIAGYFVWDRIPFLNLTLFVFGIVVLGSIWDIWATRHGKKDKIWLWQFHDEETIGIKFFDLPIEEYLFYLSASLYIIFIWEGIKLSLETGNVFMYFVIPFLGIWSFLAILIPYKIKVRGDKIL